MDCARSNSDEANSENYSVVAGMKSRRSVVHPWEAVLTDSTRNAWPIQKYAIPLIYRRRDLLVRAAAGSGKTLAYLIPILRSLFTYYSPPMYESTKVFIIAPTRESCEHVNEMLVSLAEWLLLRPAVALLTTSTYSDDLMADFNAESPDIIISTPDFVKLGLERRYIEINEDAILVLDQMDLLLMHGYETTLKFIMDQVPQYCECLVFTTDRSSDPRRVNSIIKRNPYILTLEDGGVVKVEIIPYNAEQLYILCSADHEKLIHLKYLLKYRYSCVKVLIFTNSTVTSQRLKLFTELFSCVKAVLDTDLSQKSRLSIEDDEAFGCLIAEDDYFPKEKTRCLIATDDGRLEQKTIDFKNFGVVINFDMPRTLCDYTLRTDRTHTAENTGVSYFLLSPEEKEQGIFNELKTVIGGDYVERSEIILPDYFSTGITGPGDIRSLNLQKFWNQKIGSEERRRPHRVS